MVVTKAPPKDRKAVAAPATRRVFEGMRCHHRNAQGQPDCKSMRAKAHQNLCPKHEAEWQKAARERHAARVAGQKAAATKAPKSAGTSPKTAGVRSSKRAADLPTIPAAMAKSVGNRQPGSAMAQLVSPTAEAADPA